MIIITLLCQFLISVQKNSQIKHKFQTRMGNKPENSQASFCSIQSWYLFPHDYSTINGYGIYCCTPKAYTGLRIIFTICISAIFAYIATFYNPKDMLYFTNWGLILTVFTYGFMLIQNILNYCYQSKTTIKYWKPSHFLFTIALFFELFINGVYWLALFPYAVTHIWGQMGLVDILNPLLAHAGPLLLLIIDFQFNPVNIWNFAYIPYYYGILIIYLVANSVYTTQVQQVYALIDYKNWISIVLLLGCGVAVMIVHAIMRVFCKCYKQNKVIELLQKSGQFDKTKTNAEQSQQGFNQNDQIPSNTQNIKIKQQNNTDRKQYYGSDDPSILTRRISQQ